MTQSVRKVNNLMITIPHSGETVPDEAHWLKGLSEEILMCDVDRFVDQLYLPSLRKFQIPFVTTPWHRYAGDLNRWAEDVDQDSVRGHKNPSGQYSRGFHWVITTTGVRLMNQPMEEELHKTLVRKIYDPFHAEVQKMASQLPRPLYHLDVHSMPSMGTAQHRDPGERRADIVISDSLGKSACEEFRNLVIVAFVTAGFRVGYNWPYVGGRLTEQYGRPQDQHHTLQVEINRDLYMDEKSKKLKESHREIQGKIEKALDQVLQKLSLLKN